jgi:CDP-glucose 4,6-dehydratase
VADLVQEILTHWQGTWEDRSDPNEVHEATLLNLATDKAYQHLQWQPVWDFEQTIEQTISWYRCVTKDPAVAADLTREQIGLYTRSAKERGIKWALS